jgi:ribosome maturation factor RimP
MARISDAELDARIHDLAAPCADELGVELEEVEVRGQRGSRKVRLVVHAEHGLDVDVIARVSRRVGEALDEQDVVEGGYTLEVTSPGADRPLRTARDFARNRGREVRITRRADADVTGGRETVGTLTAVDEDEVRLEVDGAEVTIPIGDVDHGKVVLPW